MLGYQFEIAGYNRYSSRAQEYRDTHELYNKLIDIVYNLRVALGKLRMG